MDFDDEILELEKKLGYNKTNKGVAKKDMGDLGLEELFEVCDSELDFNKNVSKNKDINKK